MKRLRSKAVSFVTALFLVLTLLPMLPQGALTADAAGEIIYVSTYDELKDALTDSANTGNTVKMTEDITDVTSIIFASYPMTLDMDGHTLKFDYNYYVYFHVRIYDSSDPFIITGNGTIDGKCGGGIVYRSAGNLKIESGTIKNINEDYGKSINVNDSDYSNITITEGKFISANRLSYDVTITEGSIRDDYDGYTVITDKYGLYVDGVQVTAQNRYDILGGGEASYDIYTKTLTIRKDISNTYFFDPCIENRSIAGLIINIAKDVTINSIWGYTILCNSNTQTTITGKGKLTLKSMYNHAIKTNYNTRLIIIDANIDITTEDFGIYGNGEIYFEHANVTINATDYYAVDHSKGIYLTECYISEPEGGSVELIDTDEETYAITDGSGNKAKTVRIKAICQDSLIATDATKATCTTEGNSAYWTCARCGKHYADSEGINEIENDSWILPPLGHDMLSFASSTPTCTEAGNIAYYYCLRCKKYFSDSNGDTEITKVDTIIPKLGHSLKMVEAKSPTCTKNGNIAYYYCKNCNKCFSDSYAKTEIEKADTIIPKLGHSLKKIEAKAPTCTANGNIAYYYCKTCRKYYSDSRAKTEITKADTVVPKKGHSIKATAAKAATCTENGNIAYYYCKTCKKYYSDKYCKNRITKADTVIPKLGHDLQNVEAKDPTCTKNGNIAYYYCKNCNKCFSDSYANTEIAKEDTVIPRLGHDYIITVVAPTCTKEGYTQHKCSRCNDNYSDDYKDATGHNWSKWKTSKAATCTASGVKTRKCSGCGISQKKTVAKLGHNYVETVVAPTCTAQGYTEHKCSRCGDFYKDTYTKATGHKWSKWRTSKEPTCIADGQQTRTCSLCKKTEKKTISKLGHDYIDTVVKPSCTKRGYTLHKCSRCGDFYKDSNTKAKGHKWSEWNTIKEPTCTADGEHTRTCSVCKKTETETIAMFGHDYIDTIVKPTCLMRGYTIHTCSRCGDTYKDTYTKATGHKFSAWKTTGYNFSKNTSAQTRKCTACGKTENQTTNNAITRIAGANRYETASVISTEMFKQSDTVIVATGLTFHDALVAVPLASAYKAPLLLATEKHITAQTEAELKRLGAKNVIVVSTNGAIGEKAKAELSGYKTTYIEGKTSFETAAKVVKALQTKTKKAPTTIFFATDSAFADALSTSPVAAIKNAPILYLKNTGSIDSATADYLKSVKGKVKNAYVIGGDGVISDAMMKNVASALGLTVNKTVQRVAGKNRYETCVAVNDKFADLLTGEGICVAKGLDFPDALAGGVYAAATKQALFLADGKKLQDCQSSYLKTKNAAKITVFGGTGAVTDELVKIIAKASV